MVHKEIPFIRIGVPLCAGIVTGLYLSPGSLFFIISGVIIIAGLITGFLQKDQTVRLFYGLSLTLALFVSGLYMYTGEVKKITNLESVETIFKGFINDFPEVKANSQGIVIRINKICINNNEFPANGGILVYLRKDSISQTILPGDLIEIRCTPLLITNRGNPYEFDYRFYMQNQGIKYYAFADFNDILTLVKPSRLKLRHRALIIRENIVGMFRERGISGTRLALVAAITLGQKNLLDRDQKENFIKAGVMHIMAVSGLHAVILSLFIFKMLFFLKGKYNIIRIIIALLFLWAFTFVTGLTPSVMRATIMFTFLQAGKLINRPVNGINSILASALVLILIKPSVIFDAGFLLSYSAVIYIISFYNDLYRKIQFKSYIPDLIWQSAAVTVIAQAGTLPLTIMMFNRFPTLFILTNIIIVPLSSLIIILGCLIPLTYPVKFLSQFIAATLDKLTLLTEILTEKAASVPFSTIENIGITSAECLFLTITIFCFMIVIFRKKQIPVAIPLSALLLFTLSGTVKHFKIRKSNELIVYNSTDKISVGIRNGREIHYFSDTLSAGKEVLRHAAVLNLKITMHIVDREVFGLNTCNKNVILAGSLDNIRSGSINPDLLIITGNRPAYSINYGIINTPEYLVFGNNIRRDYRFMRSVAAIDADSVYFIRERGAFQLKL